MRSIPGAPVSPVPGYSSLTYPGSVLPVSDGQDYPRMRENGLTHQDVLNNPPPRMRDVPYLYPITPGPARQPSRIQISVPTPDAAVWVEGVRMTTTGTTRSVVTPPLAAGNYQYEIVVRWTEQGQLLTRTRTIFVRPGDRLTVTIAN
jgi:uncharacterized protein (TIGR03000 family)